MDGKICAKSRGEQMLPIAPPCGRPCTRTYPSPTNQSIYLSINVPSDLSTCLSTYLCIHTQYMHTFILISTHSFMHKYKSYIHTCMLTYIHTYTYIYMYLITLCYRLLEQYCSSDCLDQPSPL